MSLQHVCALESSAACRHLSTAPPPATRALPCMPRPSSSRCPLVDCAGRYMFSCNYYPSGEPHAAVPAAHSSVPALPAAAEPIIRSCCPAASMRLLWLCRLPLQATLRDSIQQIYRYRLPTPERAPMRFPMTLLEGLKTSAAPRRSALRTVSLDKRHWASLESHQLQHNSCGTAFHFSSRTAPLFRSGRIAKPSRLSRRCAPSLSLLFFSTSRATGCASLPFYQWHAFKQ